MKSDGYTKTILTIIALMLTVIALRTLLTPDKVAHAQTSFAGLQVSSAGTGAPHTSFFDPTTGDLFVYYQFNAPPDHFRISKLGLPLAQIK
jgi:hypothetical protein